MTIAAPAMHAAAHDAARREIHIMVFPLSPVSAAVLILLPAAPLSSAAAFVFVSVTVC